MKKPRPLLAVASFAIPPGLDAVASKLGFQLTAAKNLRQAVALIKQISPDVVVAEFVYAPTYGSQLSNFESLFAAAQAYSPQAHFIALCHKDDLLHLEKVKAQVSHCQVLTLPATTAELENCLASLCR